MILFQMKGDAKPELKVMGEEMKNIGNGAFVWTCMNKNKHTKISYKKKAEYKKMCK